ncbi:MAG: dihydrolipoamide acetyltransferase family protein [Flavobacteriaceae bacterium]|nr:dihydrolipoamide acetyltransferase family protein [Flavobacteriaceae bacterium]
MAEYRLLLPSMGEGVMEATIIDWAFKEGDFVNEDDSVVEIATDKVDSDVPTPVSGKLVKILVAKGEVAKIGEAIAILEVEGIEQEEQKEKEVPIKEEAVEPKVVQELEQPLKKPVVANVEGQNLSPLVRSIIQEEGISQEELKQVQGSGLEGRITKEDILKYLKNRGQKPAEQISVSSPKVEAKPVANAPIPVGEGDEIIQMDRMRKIIAENMLLSKQISPHVSSFIETDVTNVVKWRAMHKATFEKREGEKLTYMPIFVRAVVKAIQDFPMINVSVDGDKIIKKKSINIGIATALPDGNLIVPVIKNADQLSLSGLAKAINQMVYKARNKKLAPQDIQGATYTISNIGTFGNLMGTPIILQPQVAILAIGAIVKKPAVLETPQGDVIAIRQKMFMSHSYDHRVVDGSLGGLFLKRVNDYLEDFDLDTEI